MTELIEEDVRADETVQRWLLTIEEAADHLQIGRTKMCQLLAREEVESVYIGRLRRVPLDCLKEYVDRLRASKHVRNAA